VVRATPIVDERNPSVEERAALLPQDSWRDLVSSSAGEQPTRMVVVDGLRALLRERLAAAGSAAPEWFADAVTERFISYQFLFTRVFVVELAIARAAGVLDGETGEARYDSFVRLVGTQPYQQYLSDKYPALETLVTSQFGHYLESAAALTDVVTRRFGRKRTIEAVSFVGDPHEYGVQAAVVVLDAGERVVLKPRSAVFDRYFAAAIELVNGGLRTPLSCGKVEQVGRFIVSEWLEDAGSSHDAAYAFGAWQAIAHYHDLVDLHFENFIMTVDGPVPVDFECSFSPSSARDGGQLSRESQWRAGLLPRAGSPSRVEMRWSPLAQADGRGVGAYQWVEDDGTDTAHLTFRPGEDHPVALDSGILRDAEQFAQFEDGFVDMQRALSEERDSLARLKDEMGVFDSETRVVRKPTRFYADVLRRVSHPRFLVDPDAHQRAIHDLVVRSGDEGDSDAARFEVDLLVRGFIPAYSSPVAGREVLGGGRVVERRALSGAEAHEARLLELADDAARTAEQRSVHQLLMCLVGHPWGEFRRTPGTDVGQRGTAVLARRIASHLWTGVDTRHRPSWQNLVDRGDGRFTVEDSGYDLYSGSPGTLLALLASEGVDTDLIVTVSEDLLDNTERWLSSAGRFGVFSGAAGAVYAAWSAHAAGHVGLAPVSEFSEQVLRACVEQSEASPEWDLLSGRAGLLLLLARLRDRDWMDANLASRLAGRLVDGLHATRLRGAGDEWWWAGPDMDSGIGGLAHGVAGVALGASHWRTLPAAEALYQGAAVSQRTLRRGPADWEDTRPYASRELADAWCHGAAGILLADESRGTLADGQDLAAWPVAHDPTERAPDLTLCHGLAGQVVSGVALLGRSHPTTARLAAELESVTARLADVPGAHMIGLSDSLFTGEAGLLFSRCIGRDGFVRVGNPFVLTFPMNGSAR
jgi:hypothetical protein